jgi:hypothetical protein
MSSRVFAGCRLWSLAAVCFETNSMSCLFGKREPLETSFRGGAIALGYAFFDLRAPSPLSP